MAQHHAARARAIGRSLMGGGKSTAVAVVSGAVAGAVGGMLQEHTDFFQKKWWSFPIAAAVAGHIVKQAVSRDAGSAILGAAGATAWYGYKLNRASAAASGTETKGVQETTGPIEDWARSLRSLPETRGVQAPMATHSSPVMSMSAAA